MVKLSSAAASAVALAVLAAAGAGTVAGTAAGAGMADRLAVAAAHTYAAAPARAPHGAPSTATLLKSPELWATVDICNGPHHPHTLGIRGSMPGDGQRHDAMYMRFIVQSLDPTAKRWSDLGKGADSGFVSIGSAATARQAGRTFEFKPTPAPYTLRGLVEFQWRRNGRAVHSASLATTARHTSLAGAEPKGFSAASCELM